MPKGYPTKGFKPLIDRFMALVSPEPFSGCWLWLGHTIKDGYGRFRLISSRVIIDGKQGRMKLSHVMAYELYIGPVPEGLELDHKCRNVLCCNPWHCEPVTHEVNVNRGVAAQRKRSITHCPRGHEYTKSNTIVNKLGYRSCRQCKRVA